MRSLVVLGVLALATAEPAMAQTRMATGSIRVERALTLTNVQPMSFLATRRNTAGPVIADTPAAGSTAPAVIDITGDPGRVYRIQLPDAISAEIDNSVIGRFRIWSQTMGDVSTTLTGRLNGEGRDRLLISGVLTLTSGMAISDISTAVPVSIDYE